MYPTAYTLTVLVLTLLQYSFDKRFAKQACRELTADGINGTRCEQHMQQRKEIRQLNSQEFDALVTVFNEYSTRNNATDELNANINELGVVPIFDELLSPHNLLTPYWQYRLELTLDEPSTSSLWSAPQFSALRQAADAEWLANFVDVDSSIHDEEFFGDDLFTQLWRRRQSALKAMRHVRKTDVFWHLMLLASIETGKDQDKFEPTRGECLRDFGRFARWTNSCEPTLGDSTTCESASDCYSRRCVRSKCAPTRRSEAQEAATTTTIVDVTTKAATTTTTTAAPTSTQTESTQMKSTLVSTLASSQRPSLATSSVASKLIKSTTPRPPPSIGADIPLRVMTTYLPATTEITPTTHAPSSTSISSVASSSSLPSIKSSPVPNNNAPDDTLAARLAVTTEFLAKELTHASATRRREGKRRGGKGRGERRKKKQREEAASTSMSLLENETPLVRSSHMPNTNQVETATNQPLEAENYDIKTLDALLVYLPTPKLPVGTITWTARVPFRMAYFSVTVIEGSLGRNKRLREKGNRRAKGVRIYSKGLDMPAGYTQVTQGKQLRTGIGALARIFHPDDNGPFVEFKMRVENRYGSPCKQLCLDSSQRYKRCARRTIRLSAYERFSDPIAYYDSETRAMNAQWTGKGYYKKRKLSYLLFKCD